MNKRLQAILNLLQQSESLTPEEKKSLADAVNESDKEISITEFKLERTEKVKRTTAILLEQTIAELEQKRKSVEGQNRELEIEASLERVRARTMGMQKSEELKDIIQVVYDQFRHLNILIEHAGFIIDYKARNDMNIWLADPHEVPTQVTIPYFDSPHWNSFNEAKEKGLDFFANLLSFEEKNRFYNGLFNVFPGVSDEAKEYYFGCPGLAISTVLLENVGLYIENFSGIPYSNDENDILIRFGKVFQQTYTRFLDLQKAEAQAREAQIETSLEKVRSRSLAMYHSDELEQVVASLFDRLVELGLSFDGALIFIFDKEKRDICLWIATNHLSAPVKIDLPYDEDIKNNAIIKDLWNAIEYGEHIFNRTYSGETKNDYFRYVTKYNESKIPESVRKVQIEADSWTAYFAAEKNSIIGFDSWSGHNITSEDFQTLIRFARVFEQTYTRFLDLQKAESQARESQIQLALERVRARTMAMHKSEELAETAHVLFQQLIELGGFPDRISIGIADEANRVVNFWTTDQQGSHLNLSFRARLTERTTIAKTYQAWKEQKKFLVIDLHGEELKEWIQFAREEMGIVVKADQIKDRRVHSLGFFSHGWILVTSHEPQSTETIQILERFASVFNLTYRRFLDLQKAEAQAREAQIEAALERVRSKTMAMHNSDDMGDTVVTMFDELVKLGVKTNRCGVLIHSDTVLTEVWTAKSNPDEKATLIVGLLDTTIHPMLSGARNSWAKKESFFSYELAGEDIKNYYKVINDSKDYRYRVAIDALPAKEIHSDFHFREGSIFAFTEERIAEDASRIFSRFAAVFGQTYTRFLDLQKAEAQTREAQIEAALERIRSRALAMHSSGDLIDVANVLREQMGLLGQPELESSIVHLYQDNSNTFEAWYAYRPPNLSSGKIISGVATVPWESSEWSKEAVGKYRSADNEYTIVSTGEKIKEWYKVLEVVAPAVVEYDQEGRLIVPEILYYHFSRFSGGALLMISNQQPSIEARELQRRAAVVFGLAVTRFFDLKRTEEQAREAQIEASLERVRGKAMAMHSSEDLAATIGIFYRELESFSITPRRCGVGLLDEETRMAELSTMNTTEQGDSVEIIGKLKMEGHPVLKGIFDNWILQCEYHPVLRGNEIKEYYQLIRPQISFPEYPNDAVQFGYFFYFTEGGVYAWTEKELAEDELKIYRKFTSVLSLTYKRYKDLKDAEIRAKEAVKQATIDRVRAEIASMRTKQDLDRITPLIWNELTILGVPFVRCGVFIMDDNHQVVHTFLSTPDGKAIAAFQLDYSVSNLKEAIRHWHDRLVYVTHWGEIEFGELADILMKQGSIVSRDQYLNTLPTEGIHLHFLPFLQGMLYVGNTTRLQQEDINLLQSLAEAFSTAYARYEDFNKLEAAKQQVDQALVELKQTQQQLIQAEKMASLGELTAGIAHEIQNPLNFVNNFAEVSNELIDEMVEEVEKGNFDEAKVIAIDVKENLEKINHHGKRADGIVKSMLQHSRSSSGQKELTDINVLCDEYLRLSYHGLRAKDKSFNAKFETDFDSTLEKIYVIPQDVGRVILNLINNAFYAVTEKRNANPDGYEATVSVSTKQRDRQVEIAVKDNANGIPQKVLDKIFQPFFTTKPTGQGTGLGLSLSYDIVRAHGGELKVETKEGVGTEFSIQLPIP